MQRYLAAALVLFCVAALSGQQSATGIISGAVTSADQGRPVRKAQVKLVSSAPKMTRTTTTDADGRFSFAKLPAGGCFLSATKPGYLESVFGARRPGATSPGTPIRLAPGQKLDDVTLRLPRGGVISGVVTDEFGDPAYLVGVRAMRFTYTNGERVAYPIGNVFTDDLGAYRIAGLLPGEYVVSAVPRNVVATAAAMAEELQNDRRR
jgi:Carboxypeptidase regulatory-like domain